MTPTPRLSPEPPRRPGMPDLDLGIPVPSTSGSAPTTPDGEDVEEAGTGDAEPPDRAPR
ncbi:hypothetical protein [Pseudonocardia sp. GCM10023141]|uniref:hypothetical protein n=1 Tax=Pseudonocardia sp. GCM10023141 TaxID=3252653 RepID=UPI00361A4133